MNEEHQQINAKSLINRPDWDEYFMDITFLVAQRSTCLRRQIGALIVREKRVLATGYNGAPSGLRHCLDTGCLREKAGIPSGERHELCRGLHAEQNAIIQAALHGVTIKDAILYCSHFPCSLCTKMLINSGIKKVVYVNGYPDGLAHNLMEESGLEIIQLPQGGGLS